MKARRLEFSILLAGFCFMTLAPGAVCIGAGTTQEEESAENLDKVLDKLEKKLIDKDDLATPKMNGPNEEVKVNKPQTTQQVTPTSPEKIKGRTPAAKNLKEIQSKITEYDNRIEILEADLRRIKSNLYDSSITDNQVMIEVRASETSKFIIRDLVAKLDGNAIYSQMDASGLWMPSKSIPLFYGPLRPGDHQITIAATIAPIATDGLELPTWKHKSFEQNFSFSVADGKIRKSFSLEITHSNEATSKPIAKLIESDIK